MKKSIAVLILFSMFSTGSLIGAIFGELKIQVDQQRIQEYKVVQALLLENVDVGLDTLLQIQSSAGTDVLFYPQIQKGNNLVLRLIAQRSGTKEEDFYDIFFLLGDSLANPLHITNQDSTVFFQKNGKLMSQPRYASHLNALFQLERSEKGEAVQGHFTAEFDYPLFESDTTYQHIWMEGNLNVPSGKFRETSLAAQAGNEAQQKTFERNLALALILVIITITAIGL